MKRIAVFSLLALLSAVAALAEPLSMDPEAPPATLIELKTEPAIGEFVGRAEGRVDEEGKRFYLSKLNVMAPLVIQVFAKDPSKPIDVSLHRAAWATDDWRGMTDENGDWGYLGRVHNEVGIELTATEPSDFYVLAWQGPAVEKQFGMVAVSVAPNDVGAGRSSGGFGQILTYIGIALAAFALAYFVIRRRDRTSAASALALVGMSIAFGHATDAIAQGVPVVEPPAFEGRLLAAETRLQQLETAMIETRDELKYATEDLADSLEFVEDMVYENFDEILQLGVQQEQFQADVQSQLDALRAQMRRKDQSHERMIEELRTLIEEDRDAEPDPTHGEVGKLPSTCIGEFGEDLEKCSECFQAANRKLEEQLRNYEQLRIIYSNTKWQIEDAIAFGDAHSGWHQLEQAEWYTQKQNIIQSFRNTQRAYEDYLAQANPNLFDILNEISRCEEEAGGIENWFGLYGIHFYNSVTNRYVRPD